MKQSILRTCVCLALTCIMTAAMAQLYTDTKWSYSDRFPKLQPLSVDFSPTVLIHPQSSLLTIHQNAADNDSIANQSIMLRYKGSSPTSHFKLKQGFIMQTGDALIGIRDQIVRKRRINEGNPLPPPTPVMRR